MGSDINGQIKGLNFNSFHLLPTVGFIYLFS